MSEKPKKASLKSMNISEKKRKKLKTFFPEIFNEEKIDFDQFKRILGEWVDPERERFGLNWPGKAECMKIIQAPSRGTLRPCKKESINWEVTENIFIEGDNLEVLKLLQKSYFGKIKMIYIDPPYNTGKEFIYPDKYTESLDTYLHYSGQKDDNGHRFSTNSDTNGRFHSQWLNMMYPRLYLARNLLREDGVIFISIDDNEQANLKKMCDEIFGEINLMGNFIWNSTKSVTNTAIISVSHTYNLVYAKDFDYYKKNRHHFRLPENGEGFENPDNDPRGVWKADPFQVGGWRPNQQYEIKNPKTGEIYKPGSGSSWKNDHTKFQELLSDNRIVFGVSGDSGPQRKRFLSEAEDRGRVSKTWWDEISATAQATEALKALFDGKKVFSNPKPVDLIKKMITLGDYTKNGIILDFFAGSSSLAHAVIQLNKEDQGSRKFICIQLPELIRSDDKNQEEAIEFCSKHNLLNTISSLSLERVRRVIKNENNINSGFRSFFLDKSCFKDWDDRPNMNQQKLFKQMEEQVDYIDPEASTEDILYELLLKDGFPLTTSIKKLSIKEKIVYSIEEGVLIICLEKKLTEELIEELASLEPTPSRVICLDAGFEGDDELKCNAVHIFKTIANHKETTIDFLTI